VVKDSARKVGIGLSVYSMRHMLKFSLVSLLSLLYRLTSGLRRNLRRVRSHAALSSSLVVPLDPSVVVLGPAEVHGTGSIRFGRDALLYPGLYLETEESASIQIGDGVVLSRGIHLVAHAGIRIGDGTMIGEYSSIRDANHDRLPNMKIRESGYIALPIVIGNEVWIGRGVTVLGGVTIGDGATVGANAVVTRNVPAGVTVVGVPARPVGTRQAY
jgi:acetyltransferase-like isoleucine patch superfamily enzyme